MEGHIRNCTCDDFKISFCQITAAQMLAYNYGIEYTGTIIRFCPWCGASLQPSVEAGRADTEELPELNCLCSTGYICEKCRQTPPAP